MNISEIASDCYMMAEVVSGKTDPEEITDFAYCIYVVFSHLVEIEHEKRLEIAKFFQQEIHRYAKEVQQGREVVHAKGGQEEETGGWTDIEPQAPKVAELPAVADLPGQGQAPAKREHADEFFKQLDEDIADMEGAIPDLALDFKKESSKKAITLEPVIQKLKPAGMMSAEPTPKAEPAFPRDAEGSKSNPIKLTKEMLSGVVSEKDLARVEKGIKVKRVEIKTKYQSIHETTLANVRTVAEDKYPDSKSVEQPVPFAQGPAAPQNELERELFHAVREIKEKPTSGMSARSDLDYEGSLSGPMLNLGDEMEDQGTTRRDLSENKICKNCKSLNPDTSKFCYRCGQPL